MKFNILYILILVFAAACQPQKALNTEDNPLDNKLKVAVFKGNGAGAVSVIETIEALRIDTGIWAVPISAAEIQNGELDKFDAIIIPGGSGSKQLNNLGEKGADILRDFIRIKGKGVVGICAGAYFLSSTAGYPNLQLVSAVHLDRAHYNRGRGLIEFALNETGEEVFPELKNHSLFLQYYDGPVLAHSDSVEGDYQELGTFVSDIHPDDFAPANITPGKTFFLRQEVGNGKVFITAGHPESTPGMRWMVPRMIRWVCNSQAVDYNPKWIKPEINDSAIIFNKALKKYEKEIFWELFSQDSKNQVQALDNLYALRSRPAVRWSIGLLRSHNSQTRKRAALFLKDTEYSDALPDLKAAFKLEDDVEVRLTIKEAIDFLENK